ncbi:copper resistance protein CopC [Streptosporangiaceae bacterium NEAU-GS5]|nr:copper resistance protein CopC [Streptosporangiaceae bacterium NEAU-GS5]
MLAILAAFVFAAPAHAHTSLKSSDPKTGAEVTGLAKVTLIYEESVRFPVVVVNGPGGKRYDAGKPQVDGPRVTQAVAAGLPVGNYAVAWRVVAQDGHPVEGEIPFTVLGTASSNSASPKTAPSNSASSNGSTTSKNSTLSQVKNSADGVPGWVWIVVFGLAGIGIGMAFSLRKKS